MIVRAIFITTVFIVSLVVPLLSVQASDEVISSVLINEIKLGGAVDGQPTQFVELVNATNQVIDMTDWRLEYAKAGFTTSACDTLSWEAADTDNFTSTTTLSTTIPATAGSTQGLVGIELPLTDNNSGSIQLVNKQGMRQDMVGWGESAPCASGSRAVVIPNGQSLQRYLECEGSIVHTGDNREDFAVAAPSPSQSNTQYLPSCEEPDDKPPLNYCEGITISEIVPNPSGSDSGAEFIELHNPTTDTISLPGCALKVGSDQLNLSGEILPNGYQAFYGLTLPNAAGGRVELIMTTEEQVVDYPADMKDDMSWSYYQARWQISEKATPGLANSIVITENNKTTDGGKGNSLGPCPAGKFRNPETNRCKNIVSTASLTPCKPGQVRNPDTNRCRSTATASSSLVPCKPGQERNPATNRCRSVAGTSRSLVPCKPGYERNPDTNRCRKATATSTSALTTPATTAQSKSNYIALGLVSLLALGYGAYEYRQSIAELLKRLAGSIVRH